MLPRARFRTRFTFNREQIKRRTTPSCNHNGQELCNATATMSSSKHFVFHPEVAGTSASTVVGRARRGSKRAAADRSHGGTGSTKLPSTLKKSSRSSARSKLSNSPYAHPQYKRPSSAGAGTGRRSLSSHSQGSRKVAGAGQTAGEARSLESSSRHRSGSVSLPVLVPPRILLKIARNSHSV